MKYKYKHWHLIIAVIVILMLPGFLGAIDFPSLEEDLDVKSPGTSTSVCSKSIDSGEKYIYEDKILLIAPDDSSNRQMEETWNDFRQCREIMEELWDFSGSQCFYVEYDDDATPYSVRDDFIVIDDISIDFEEGACLHMALTTELAVYSETDGDMPNWAEDGLAKYMELNSEYSLDPGDGPMKCYEDGYTLKGDEDLNQYSSRTSNEIGRESAACFWWLIEDIEGFDAIQEIIEETDSDDDEDFFEIVSDEIREDIDTDDNFVAVIEDLADEEYDEDDSGWSTSGDAIIDFSIDEENTPVIIASIVLIFLAVIMYFLTKD